jgi:heme exporter protein B
MARARRSGDDDKGAQGQPWRLPPAPASWGLAVGRVWSLLRKDLVTEVRSKETLLTLVFFACLVVVIFAFSLGGDEEVAREVAPGVIWIATAFAGTLAVDRSFAQEQEGHTLTALILVPGLRLPLYIAKSLLNILWLWLVLSLVAPLALLVLGLSVPTDGIVSLVVGLMVGSVGFALVGTLFSAMLVSLRRRGVLLPIILYPVTIPLLVMGVEAASIVVQNRPVYESWGWIKIMGAVDLLYLMGGAWLFGQVLEDE